MMLSESEALEKILAAISPSEAEAVPLARSLRRYARSDIHATVAIPRCDVSSMDGYAIHEIDCGKTGCELTVVGEQPAGLKIPGLSVSPGQTVRIFTGAPLPCGSGAVVMQEDTEKYSPATVRITESASPGEYIRRAGADLCEGQKILSIGQRISPAIVGLLASQGLTAVSVGPLPRVSIIATGAELIAPGSSLTDEGQIYNSNGEMLRAQLLDALAAENASVLALPDDPDVLARAFQEHLENSDALVIAGGVSVGDHDHTRACLEKCGVNIDIWRVNMKPGKPFLFGTLGKKLAFGLPGNPVSAFVTTQLFVIPALRKFMGSGHPENSLTRATLEGDLANPDRRPSWIRGKFDPATGLFQSVSLQESHALHALSRANALLRIPGQSQLSAGATVGILTL